jgi:MFS family permease
VLVTGAIGSLTYGLIEAGERGWGDSLILTAFAVSAVLFAAFVVVESRTEKPMVPLRFFRSSTFTAANIDAFAVSFFISGIAFSMTMYFQNVHGYSPMKNGLTMIPMVVTMMVFAPVSGSLVNRIGTSRLISLGMLIAGVAAFLYLRTSADARFLDVLPAMVVMGFGFALIFAPMTTAVLNSVESDKSGIASAVNGAVRETGFAFGVALLGTIMNTTYKERFADSDQVRSLASSSQGGQNPVQALIGFVGEGFNFAGRVILNPQGFPAEVQQLIGAVPEDAQRMLVDASSVAFVDGMHRSFLITGIAIIAVAILSYFMINDRVAESEAPDPETMVQSPNLAGAAPGE